MFYTTYCELRQFAHYLGAVLDREAVQMTVLFTKIHLKKDIFDYKMTLK